MSFILDALKKSENERQRTSGPALFEVKTAKPRSRLPVWALVVGALLAINLVVLIWVLLHRESSSETMVAQSPKPNVPAAATSLGAAPIANSKAPVQYVPMSAAQGPPVPTTMPAQPMQAVQASPSAGEPPLAPGVGDAADTDDAANEPADELPAVEANSAAAIAAQRERERAQRATADQAARVREQTQTTTTNSSVNPNANVTLRGAGLPTRDELVNSGRARIPELTMSLHAFDPNPARRFVFINGQRAHEGDAVGGGVVLETITRDGAILSIGGQKFGLPVQ